MSWCFIHALYTYRARRGTEKSIYWGSSWSSSLGSMGKNKYCLSSARIWFRRWILILQNWIDPSSSRCTVWLCRRRLITFFDTSYAARVGSDGSMSIHFLSCIGMVAVVPTSSLCCGFAFAFDLAAITLSRLWRLNFMWICRGFCIAVIWIDHVLVCSIGYSDPRLRIILTHRPDSNFNPMFSVLKTGCDF